jgi:hypothetical protein
MATPFLSSPWPSWTNPRIRLFHGTNTPNSANIIDTGVDLSKCKPNRDFGVGFYTTTNRQQAWLFAQKKAQQFGGQPSVVSISFDREVLANFLTIAFILGSLEATHFWSFVSHCRRGALQRPASGSNYDVAYGPVTEIWVGPENSRLHEGYDQISFHNAVAVCALNNGEHCSREVDLEW